MLIQHKKVITTHFVRVGRLNLSFAVMSAEKPLSNSRAILIRNPLAIHKLPVIRFEAEEMLLAILFIPLAFLAPVLIVESISRYLGY